MRNILDKSCRQNQNTHLMFNFFFFRKSCPLCHNVQKYSAARWTTDDHIIQRMRTECWITKATETHSEHILLIAFPRQQWLRERASVLRLYGTLPALLSHHLVRAMPVFKKSKTPRT